jgi:hypothetical protein
LISQLGDDGWSKGVEAAAAMSSGLGNGWVNGVTCNFAKRYVVDEK